MALNKKAEFPKSEIRLAELAKALSHPARIAILKLLAKRNTCICGEIVDELPLAQSTVSQHLKELKAVGLVQGEIDGPKSCYCINWGTLQDLENLIGSLFKGLDRGNKAKCC
jgi:DNA-binding transcriptional ArsR family regulator